MDAPGTPVSSAPWPPSLRACSEEAPDPRKARESTQETLHRPHLRTGPEDEGLLDDDAMIAILFSCPEAHSAVLELLKRFGLAEAKLPIHPFAWGLDSI